MEICHTKQDLRATLAELRGSGTIGLVPTMGYLHDGHMSLVQHALQENDHTVASIFVNPTQFGNADDLSNYPRALENDLTLLRDAGVAAVFTPTPEIMYHNDAQTIVETTELANTLMGALRPGHFRGVATVVTKLFNLFQPDRAYFGEKDFQQLAVIRAMVRDLDIPVSVRGIPTVRHQDGLAMSSRNARLSPDARAAAPILHQACLAAQDRMADRPSAQNLSQFIHNMIASEPMADIQSVDIRDAVTLEPIDGKITQSAVILLAVAFDPVLLIDQFMISTK
jgi:pantoate--beta-alanine ligase